MDSLKKQIIAKHIEDHYPNAKIANSTDYENSGLKYYTLKELQKVEEDWFPLCCHKDEKTGELIYGGKAKIFHTYVEGETGSGKTTRVLIQNLNALSNLKKKSSFLIVDPFGEIFRSTYYNFKQRGYKVQVLNCDEPSRSDTYNPFASMAKKCLEAGEITDDVLNRIRHISEIIQPVIATNDPIWEQGACSYFNGLILDCFEDLVQGLLPKEALTIYNIIQRHFWIRERISNAYERNIFSIDHYNKKGSKALSVQKIISVTNNAEKTRDSYWGVVENRLDAYGQKAMYMLSSNSTIDVEQFINEPTIIYVQSGISKVGNDLVSLLINDIYETVLKLGKKGQKNLNIHCFLDEFTNYNYGSGENFIQMLTTSRKFGMFWHMFLQCDAQVERKFDYNLAATIRGNTTEFFMGSQDYKTISRFAESCGKRTIESLKSKVSQNDISLETVDLVTEDKLMMLPEGNMYITLNRQKLLYSYYEAFYNCQVFEKVKDTDNIYPVNSFDYESTYYIPEQYEETINKNSFEEENLTNRYFKLIEKMKWVRTIDGKMILVVDIEDNEHDKMDFFPESTNVYDMDQLKVYNAEQLEVINEENQIFEIIEEFMTTQDVSVVTAKLKQFSIVPPELIEAIENPQDEENTFSANMLKFAVIEQFIMVEEFETQEKYLNEFAKELDELRELNILPKVVIRIFKKAYQDLDDLTIENIEEIKKIINNQ